MNNAVNNAMGLTMDKIKEMVDVNTVVGTPIVTNDGTTLIPISRVSFGFGSGGTDFSKANKEEPGKDHSDLKFGAGGGAGVSITPISFLVIANGTVKMLPIGTPASTTVDRVVDLLPELIDKVTALINKKNEEKVIVSGEELL